MISEVLHTDEIMLSVLGIAITIGMIVGAAVYPYISRKLNSRLIASLGGYSLALFYFTFLLVGRFITSTIIMYIIISLISFTVGIAISLLSSFCSVEFVKNIEEEYMARTSAIFGAVCVAAMPVVSFLVSAVAGFTSTAVLFLVAGILDIVICINLCSKKRFQFMLKEKTEAVSDEKEFSDSSAC
jgi:MFS family permease